ncbi:MAG: ABC transporter ATP-binding protein [Thermoplasmata archaeon]|nr:ABC transporter ATP-binding protein [Thermoplasmata archaeon]
MPSLISTNGINKAFGPVRALSGVTLDVPRGATGLLGPNGAGKSTLIRALVGLVKPDSGTGRVLGLDIASRGVEIRRRIGYMPEHECLIGELSAVEMVAYAGQVSGMTRKAALQRAHEVLHFVGMGDERYREVGTYSTGMKQKVNLAQALVHDPELLLLDEPTNGLDPRGRREMLDLLRFLARDAGKSVLLSSHILPDVEHVCDHVVVLAGGEVLLQGDMRSQLRGEPGVMNVRAKGDIEAFASGLATRGYSVDAADPYMLRVVTGGPETGSSDTGGWEETMTCDIMAAAAASGVQVRYASASVMHLEDLFMEIVQRGGGEEVGR